MLIFSRTGNGNGGRMNEELSRHVSQVQRMILDQQEQETNEWENASDEMIAQAQVRAAMFDKMLPTIDAAFAVLCKANMIKTLCADFRCTESMATRAFNLAPGLQMKEMFEKPTGLAMWDDRENWTINPDITRRELAYGLVKRLVLETPVFKELLSVKLNDPEYTVFIQRPEQSGKTFTCTLLSWLGNLCYGQFAYVLLRTGSGAAEDYGKYGESVDALNNLIWQCVVGYAVTCTNGVPTYTKLSREEYDKRLCKKELETSGLLEGFMRPFVLRSFSLRDDKELKSESARIVMQNKYPLVFSRLCTASNVSRALDHEMEKLIGAYGINEYGFAKMTLPNDEYQQHVKEGSRVQEELHLPLSENNKLFEKMAEIIKKTSIPRITTAEAQQELQDRFEKWESEDEERADTRRARSSFSACITCLVRISATAVSGLVCSEGWEMRKSWLIELKVDDSYYGNSSSVGIDNHKEMRIEARGSSDLEFLEEGCYPYIQESLPKIQKFVMNEFYTEVAREGYAHILFQSCGGNNASLFGIARFLIAHADLESPEKPVIAITTYMYTVAGEYPGGPWLVFSNAALPLRLLIAGIARDLYVDADPKRMTPVPEGKVALPKGSKIAEGIQYTFPNALQLPKHGYLYLKRILALVDGAVEKANFAKENIKLVSIGAGLLKVGMTPKTSDHRMSVTLGLLSATDRQLKNMSLEDISQGVHGRISGSRAGDPYWIQRGDDRPLRLVVPFWLKDQLATYKKIQAYIVELAIQRAKEIKGSEKCLFKAMHGFNFQGFSDLSKGTIIWKDGKRINQHSVVYDTCKAIRGGSTTGAGASRRSQLAGSLTPSEEIERQQKFLAIYEDHPDLFATTKENINMPMFNDKIWFRWNSDSGTKKWGYQGTIIDIEIDLLKNQLLHTIRFDTNDHGERIEDEHQKEVKDDAHLDKDMNEWSYEDPNKDPNEDSMGS